MDVVRVDCQLLGLVNCRELFLFIANKTIFLKMLDRNRNQVYLQKIQGWCNQPQQNIDQIALANILCRKSTQSVLPQLQFHHNQPIKEKNVDNTPNSKVYFNTKTAQTQQTLEKDYRQRTQQFSSKIRDTVSPLKQKLKYLKQEEQYFTFKQNKSETLRPLLSKEEDQKKSHPFLHLYKQTELPNQSKEQTKKISFQNLNKFGRTYNMLTLYQPQEKKKPLKHLLKLSNLDLIDSVKIEQIKEAQKKSKLRSVVHQSTEINLRKYKHNDLIQVDLEKIKQIEAQRAKRTHNKLSIIKKQKIQERFKQAFTKQDIFSKSKKKYMEKVQKSEQVYEFNDDGIFVNKIYTQNYQPPQNESHLGKSKSSYKMSKYIW